MMFSKLKSKINLLWFGQRSEVVYTSIVTLFVFFVGTPNVFAAGGALPTTNPFVVDWNTIFNGGVGSQIIPLVNWALGLVGLYILVHGIVGVLRFTKQLMKGETDYKKIIPVVAGFIILLLFLTGGWYNLLYGILNVVNKSFSAAPQG